MALALGALLIFGALFLAFAAVGGMTQERSGVSRSLAVLQAMTDAPDELKSELDRPFGERVLEPLYQRLQRIGRRITGADQVERIRQRLDKAGNPDGWTVDRVATGKVLGFICGFVFAGLLALMLHKGWGVTAVLVAGGALFGFNAPSIFLYNVALKRDQTMQKEIADAIDLLTISVEAGLGFDAALQQVARNTQGPVALEFSRVLQEMQIGRGRTDALRALGDRTSIPEIRGFISAMVQADAFGIPIAQVLRVQSREMRTKRRQRAEEKAAQVPVKIMVPVVLFILPCLFIVVIGPAAISIARSFG
ncbi:type II secretion system F family protein [Nocardioides cavernaquae]|uniref:Type II secretion system F family protein n=1 Tax=Nocardioides cavernaquae TaxID=2321396 RepID=A0A3A5H4M1_9ACTN|nr:type II secretion system F family protein [Nocardioides cavernaquae]RJS44841.1 type II secretion system F family protein [Nocardioides cavernaquae]